MNETSMQAPVAEDDEISLVELLTAVGEEKAAIGVITAIATAIGLATALLMTPIYSARTTLLPPQQAQSASSAMAASLGALAATAGVAGAFKAPEELYVGLLRSNSVADALITRFKLKDRYKATTLDGTRKALESVTRVSADRKSSLITVEVDDKDPAFSAELANAYVDELRQLMRRVAVTEAQQRRLFFEQQMEKAKNDLVRAEIAAKQAQETSGLVSLDAQTQSSITAAAQLRANIVAREVQLQAMRPYAGPENTDMKRLLSEIGGLRTQLAKLEGGSDAAPSSPKDAATALANVRAFRELKFSEAVYSALLQQFQLAKSDEARDAPLVQQIDRGLPPDQKSKPRRSVIVLVAVALGVLLGLVTAFVRRAARKARTDPQSSRQWQQLLNAWSFGRRKSAAQ